jgi:hypothetical protein
MTVTNDQFSTQILWNEYASFLISLYMIAPNNISISFDLSTRLLRLNKLFPFRFYSEFSEVMESHLMLSN